MFLLVVVEVAVVVFSPGNDGSPTYIQCPSISLQIESYGGGAGEGYGYTPNAPSTASGGGGCNYNCVSGGTSGPQGYDGGDG